MGRRSITYCLTVIALATIGDAYAQESCPITGAAGVYLYEDTNFRGRCAFFTATGTQYPGNSISVGDLSFSALGNNRASSIRIIGEFSVTLYNHPDFRDDHTVFGGSDPDLGDDAIGNDRASSILGRMRGGLCNRGEGAYLFEDSRCRGLAARITADVADLGSSNVGEDRASSLSVDGDFALTLYRDRNFRGPASTFVGSDTRLNDEQIGDNTASSARIRESRCDGTPGVYLYQHSNFSGRCSRFETASPRLGIEYILNDQASSVRTIGDYRVTIFREAEFGGVNSVFRDDDADFSDNAIGHDQASSMRVATANTVCNGDPGIYLFSELNFKGRCSRLTDNIRDLANAFVGDDNVSSVRMIGGYTARLFADRDTTGDNTSDNTRFAADMADLSGTTIGSNRASAVHVTGPFPEQEPIARIQLRITTANDPDAGTDDDVFVSLQPDNATWIDYGGDDFERGSRLTYDLLADGIGAFNDIDWLYISKTGDDGWCIARIELAVNGRREPVFSRSFSPCRWLDNARGARRELVVGHADLRATPRWPGFVQPDISELAAIGIDEIVSRIEGLVGHFLHGTQARWGKISGDPVEVTRVDALQNRVRFDLDLEGLVDGLPNPEIDVDFDLVASCQDGNLHFKVENLDASASFPWFVKFLDLFKGRIERRIEAAIPAFDQEVEGSEPCHGVLTGGDGSINVF